MEPDDILLAERTENHAENTNAIIEAIRADREEIRRQTYPRFSKILDDLFDLRD